MTVDDFVAITKRVIADAGLANYLPTLVLPSREQVTVLDGVPKEINVELAVIQWCHRVTSADEDYFLAFAADSLHFKVIARVNGQIEERVVSIGTNDSEFRHT